MVLRLEKKGVTYERYFKYDEPRVWRKGKISFNEGNYLFLTEGSLYYVKEIFRMGNILPFDTIDNCTALFVGPSFNVAWDSYHNAYIYNDDGTLYKEL